MPKTTTNSLIIRAQTVHEEFAYLMKVLGKMDFYNQHGYNIVTPNHPFFLNIAQNPHLLKSLDIEEAKNLFQKEVYDPNFFESGIKTIKGNIDVIEKAIKKTRQRNSWKFKHFPIYQIKLTVYGPGGTYNFHDGSIIIRTDKNGVFKRSDCHTIVHEIIHIGIEESVIKKFKLTHTEKEGLVDAICTNYFDDILLDYKVQRLGDKKVFSLISKDNIKKLPELIRRYKEHTKNKCRLFFDNMGNYFSKI